MILPEWFYWYLCGFFLLLLIGTNLRSLLYRCKRRFRYNDTHIRVFMFHLNHTCSSAWIPVDSKDANSKIVTYEKKTYIYRQERIIRLPPSFGIFSREPCLFYTENNVEPLDMPHILLQLKQKKGADELFAAVNTKVFIDMMAGVPKDKTLPIIIVLCVIGGIIYFAMEMMKGGGAT